LYAARGQKMKAQEAFAKARDGFEKLGAQAHLDAVDVLVAELE
jgi:hypothetical protein